MDACTEYLHLCLPICQEFQFHYLQIWTFLQNIEPCCYNKLVAMLSPTSITEHDNMIYIFRHGETCWNFTCSSFPFIFRPYKTVGWPITKWEHCQIVAWKLTFIAEFSNGGFWNAQHLFKIKAGCMHCWIILCIFFCFRLFISSNFFSFLMILVHIIRYLAKFSFFTEAT